MKPHNSSIVKRYGWVWGFDLLWKLSKNLQSVTCPKCVYSEKSVGVFCFEKIYLYLAEQNGVKMGLTTVFLTHNNLLFIKYI